MELMSRRQPPISKVSARKNIHLEVATRSSTSGKSHTMQEALNCPNKNKVDKNKYIKQKRKD